MKKLNDWLLEEMKQIIGNPTDHLYGYLNCCGNIALAFSTNHQIL